MRHMLQMGQKTGVLVVVMTIGLAYCSNGAIETFNIGELSSKPRDLRFPLQFSASIKITANTIPETQEYPPRWYFVLLAFWSTILSCNLHLWKLIRYRTMHVAYDYLQKLAKAEIEEGYEAAKLHLRRYDKVGTWFWFCNKKKCSRSYLTTRKTNTWSDMLRSTIAADRIWVKRCPFQICLQMHSTSAGSLSMAPCATTGCSSSTRIRSTCISRFKLVFLEGLRKTTRPKKARWPWWRMTTSTWFLANRWSCCVITLFTMNVLVVCDRMSSYFTCQRDIHTTNVLAMPLASHICIYSTTSSDSNFNYTFLLDLQANAKRHATVWNSAAYYCVCFVLPVWCCVCKCSVRVMS